VACKTDGVCTEQGDEERVFDPSERMKLPMSVLLCGRNRCSRLPNRLYEPTKKQRQIPGLSVFASEPLRTAENVKASRSYLDSADGLTNRVFDASGFLTSIAGTGLQPD
jgi:hypothetical protein